jgi:hypothetical protein
MKTFLQCEKCENNHLMSFMSLELKKDDSRKNGYCLIGDELNVNSNINYILNQKIRCNICSSKYNFILKQHKGCIVTEFKLLE